MQFLNAVIQFGQATLNLGRLTAGRTFVAPDVSGVIGLNQNASISVTKSGNALTIALKTWAGTDPSSADPVAVTFRSATLTDSKPVTRSITSALSTTISAGSTLGFSASETGRIYVGLIDNAGTPELCVWRSWTGLDLKSFPESTLQSTTAEGGSGGADSAGVLYSTDARSNVPFVYLAFFDIQTGATAGNWSNDPTVVQMLQPWSDRTGKVMQTVRQKYGEYDSTTSTFTFSDSIPQNTLGKEFMSKAITPTSSLNLLTIEAQAALTESTAHTAIMALFQDNVANALSSIWSTLAINGAAGILRIEHEMIAGTTSSTTFKARASMDTGGTLSFNGSGSRYLGGTMNSFISVKETFV